MLFQLQFFKYIDYDWIDYSEEDAIITFEQENLNFYFSIFTPIDCFYFNSRHDDRGHSKLVLNKVDDETFVGFQHLSLNAVKVTQCFGIFFKLKATKSDFIKLLVFIPPILR